jgi:hypothetical protein
MTEAVAALGIKIVVDSNAQTALGDLQKGAKKSTSLFAQMKTRAQSSMQSIGAGAVMAGQLYAKAVMMVAQHGRDAFLAPLEAIKESDKQVREMAATFALLNESTAGFAEIQEYASVTKDELERMGMAAGVADDTLVAVFQNVYERGGKSVDAAKELTEQMAYAGRAIPGGALALSEGFEQIEMGVIRAKNPIVGMIAATGMLKGNAKQVAKEMQKMSVDEQMKLAEKAVAKMSTKMKDVPMTFDQIVTSMKVMTGNLLETMGAPMMAGLTKAAAVVRNMFLDKEGNSTALTEKLTQGAEFFGNMLAGAFELVKPFVDGFMQGMSEFNGIFTEVWKEVFSGSDTMAENLKAAAKFVGQMLGSTIKVFALSIGALIVAVEKSIKFLIAAAGKVMQFVGADKTGNKAMVLAHGSENEDLKKTIQSGGAGQQDRFSAWNAYKENLLSEGKGEREINQEFVALTAEHERVAKVMADAKAQAAGGNADAYVAAYGEAAKAQDAAAQTAILSYMASNEAIAQTIATKGPDAVAGGVKDMISRLRAMGDNKDADILEAGQKKKMQSSLSKPTVVQDFRGSTFNLKQDFRDQDPDRVAVAFQDDIGNAAASRLQSRFASPFGF